MKKRVSMKGMSTTIPFEIQEEILKRVFPVKSFIRFRCVSKQWMSLIDSSEFITHHTLNQNRPHHLLVSYFKGTEEKYVSIVDDDSFPYHKFSHESSPTVKQSRFPSILGCSLGLICLFACSSKTLLVIWNPIIRKSFCVKLEYEPFALGFGVCPKTFDPKIVKVTRWSDIHYKAEIFTLSSRVWKSISMNLSRKPIFFLNNVVNIDGLIHWVVTDMITKNDEKTFVYRIITFDLTSEEFEEANLPDCLSGPRVLDISKLRESLVVLDYGIVDAVCDVWMMLKIGVQNCLFTKLFTVKVEPCSIIGFRKNGQLIIDKMNRFGCYYSQLQVYEPVSEQMNGLGIYGTGFKMTTYKESLLLLHHYDSSII